MSSFSIPFGITTLLVQNEDYRAKLKKSNERTLALIKAGMDAVVAVGLLQLAPKKVTPRVTGAFGFVTSLISCYQVHASMIFCLRIMLVFIRATCDPMKYMLTTLYVHTHAQQHK